MLSNQKYVILLDMSTYNIRQFAERIGVSVRTLQRWDREGRLKPLRTPGNRRLYTDEHLNHIMVERGVRPPPTRKTIVYLRVSSHAQKSDMDNQRQTIEQFCTARGLVVDEWIAEIGGGLNFKRPKLLNLVDRIVADQVGTLIIAHQDRLSRFGYDLVTHLCTSHQCEMIVLNQETLSPEREVVQDLMTILDCFSSRLAGLRNYRKFLKETLAYDESGTHDTPKPNS